MIQTVLNGPRSNNKVEAKTMGTLHSDWRVQHKGGWSKYWHLMVWYCSYFCSDYRNAYLVMIPLGLWGPDLTDNNNGYHILVLIRRVAFALRSLTWRIAKSAAKKKTNIALYQRQYLQLYSVYISYYDMLVHRCRPRHTAWARGRTWRTSRKMRLPS